jgi:hypothetical protein
MSELRDTQLDADNIINTGRFSCCDGNRLGRELDVLFTRELLANADVLITTEDGALRLRVRLRDEATDRIHRSAPDMNQPGPVTVLAYGRCPGPPQPWPPRPPWPPK